MCGVSLWNEASSSYGFELTVIPVRMGWAGKELRNEEKKIIRILLYTNSLYKLHINRYEMS